MSRYFLQPLGWALASILTATPPSHATPVTDLKKIVNVQQDTDGASLSAPMPSTEGQERSVVTD